MPGRSKTACFSRLASARARAVYRAGWYSRLARARDRGPGSSRALDAGVSVTHVDSHRHLHKFASRSARLWLRALPRSGVTPRVRAVQDISTSSPPRHSPTYWLRNSWREAWDRSVVCHDRALLHGSEGSGSSMGRKSCCRAVCPGARRSARSRWVSTRAVREPWRAPGSWLARSRARPQWLGDGVDPVDWRTLVPVGGGSNRCEAVSVVIPARDAGRRWTGCSGARRPGAPPAEVIVVDDGSTDETAAVAERRRASRATRAAAALRGRRPERGLGRGAWRRRRVPRRRRRAVAGLGRGRRPRARPSSRARSSGARARSRPSRVGLGRAPAGRDAVPAARRPRERAFLSSFCLVVPRDASLRWDESYGGEDALFCADALAAGLRLVFDPRFHARTSTGGGLSAISAASSGVSRTAWRAHGAIAAGRSTAALVARADPLLRACCGCR